MALLEDKFEKKEDKKTTIGVIRSQPRVATGTEVVEKSGSPSFSFGKAAMTTYDPLPILDPPTAVLDPVV
jgi:hypothetical protein